MLARYLFFTSTVMTISWISACPENDVCNCTETAMLCVCDSRKDITVTSHYNFGIRHILIKGCGVVDINAFSIYRLSLDSLELTDLRELRIRGFALSRLQKVENFSISNIQNMQVDRFGFSTLFNIQTLSISNVSWKNMWKESFGGVSTVENFIITDCEFQNVKPHALILHNITKFHVINSHFGKVGNRSLLLHGAKEVLFKNCMFAQTNYTIFSMSYIEVLSLQKCFFNVLETAAFFVDEVDFFTMSNCTVNSLKTRAFENVRILNNILFSDNTVNLAEEDSLYFSTDYVRSKKLETDFSGNRITCDCNLSWLWKNQTDIYRDFIESSFCIGRSNTVKISTVGPLICSKSECSKLNDTLFEEAENNEVSSTLVFYTISESRAAQRNGTPLEVHYSGAREKFSLYVTFCLFISLWMQFCW